jgi:hypothetical protein
MRSSPQLHKPAGQGKSAQACLSCMHSPNWELQDSLHTCARCKHTTEAFCVRNMC